jgi:hypothetical protein
MPNPFRRSVRFEGGALVPVLLLCLSGLIAPHAIAQSTPPPTPTYWEKQLGRIDFGVSAVGILSNSISGIEQRDASVPTIIGGKTYISSTALGIRPSSTVGEIFTLRYVAKPYVGFELNVGNARYTENYTFTTTTTPTPPTALAAPNYLPGGVQHNAREITLGYVAHPPHTLFGIQPFLGAGGGTIRFKPTVNGGEGLPEQYRAVYYYDVGADEYFPVYHFGFRASFRQLIYLAPDFEQNYLTITRRERTSEPTFGLFLRF